jgi:tetratricopeptide (TPR) repeat protein
VDARFHLGISYAAVGAHAEAMACFERVVALDPRHSRALNNLGAVYAKLGRTEEALDCHRRAWELAPDYDLALQNLCNALIGLHRFAEALARVTELRRRQPENAVAWMLTGVALNGLRRVDDAVDAFERALELSPKDAQVWIQFGAVLTSQGRFDEASRALRIATELDPRNADAWARLGLVVNMQHDVDSAIQYCQTAIRLQPDDPMVYERLASILEKANRLDEAQVALDASFRLLPDSPTATCRQAELELRRGSYRDALDRLLNASRANAALTSVSWYNSLVGKAHDKLGEPDAAFAAFSRANELDRASPRAVRAMPENAQDLAMTQELHDWLTADRVGRWPSQPADQDGPPPVFLVGFPRSGTTLMDSILSSHSRIVTLEEKPVLQQVVARFLANVAGLEQLDHLSDADLVRLRAEYRRSLRSCTGEVAADTVVIDKMPLSIILLGVIYRLFPEARILVALRHPLDVVLSCFMQRFLMNAKMYNFLTLEGTARYYVRVMELYQHCRRVVPLAYHTYRYEEVLSDFEGQVRSILSFLELPWEEGVHDYRAGASTRVFSTPSYTEVVRPLHREAIYRWKRYQGHLTGILPEVESLIEALDYELPREAPHAMREMPLNSSAVSSMALP